MFAFAAQAFVTMFVIIDPPGLAPIFISVAGDRPPEAQRHLARKAIGISAIVLAVFAAGGSPLFSSSSGSRWRLSPLPAGSCSSRSPSTWCWRNDTARRPRKRRSPITGTTFPCSRWRYRSSPDRALSPPSSSWSVKPAPIRNDLGLLAAASAAVLLMAYASLRLAGLVSKFLGQTGINVVTRILGLILAALAVQYVANGVLALI